MTSKKDELIEAIQAADALIKLYKYNKAKYYFPDKGPYSRDHYPDQMRLMRAGKTFRIRALVGGNGSGKTLWNALETYYHLSGKYPHWWDGLKFDHPITAMVAGINGEQLRDGIQKLLFGGIGDEEIGSGTIAREDMIDDQGHLQKWIKPAISNCIAQVRVRHYTDGIFDGWSTCDFKVYEQGWGAFQGTTLDWASIDEEPEDSKIMAEIMRGLRPKDGGDMGNFLATFTPTRGFTQTFTSFVPNGIPPIDGLHPDNPSKFTVMIGWRLGSNESCPHLSEEYKRAMVAEWAISDPNNIEARMTGIAAMGSGLVYPITQERIVTSREPIPSYWKKSFGLDPGQANFACLWLAQDPNTGVIYAYDEYKTKQHVLYLIHSEAIKLRGDWITGGIDPHEAVKPRDTGETVQSYFESNGVKLISAKGDPDALRMRIRAMFESGALKVMDSCPQLLNELRTYRFDGKDPNKIAKNQDDHLCDALMRGICVFDAVSQSYSEIEEELYQARHANSEINDEQRDPRTGY